MQHHCPGPIDHSSSELKESCNRHMAAKAHSYASRAAAESAIRTGAYPPLWRNSGPVEADCGAQIGLFCVPGVWVLLVHRCAESVAERRAVRARPRG
jgi:hypothetical protein